MVCLRIPSERWYECQEFPSDGRVCQKQARRRSCGGIGNYTPELRQTTVRPIESGGGGGTARYITGTKAGTTRLSTSQAYELSTPTRHPSFSLELVLCQVIDHMKSGRWKYAVNMPLGDCQDLDHMLADFLQYLSHMSSGRWQDVNHISSGRWQFVDHISPGRCTCKDIEQCTQTERVVVTTLKPVPWKAILTSPPVWAAISVQSGGAYVTYTFMSELPTYSKNVLHFDVQGNLIYEYFNYYIVFLYQGCIGPSICLLLVTLVGCNTAAVVALLVTTQFLYGSYYGGSFMNSLDLGINYAGSISGIGLTIVNSMGIFSAQVAGLLTDGEQSTTQWNKVFYIAMGVIIVPFVIFMIFGSTEEQEWNKQERDEERSKEVRRLERKKKMSMEHIPNI
ncbi:unnamed protein product [Timema podura]|uniref:Uncharacterized protein n=1 Tax=Timema podura TaxID=61482 RepID=A0ABN7NDP5_TIMPD|nr:unnamed protein product [Timema podura]